MTILWHQQARQDLKLAIAYCRKEFGQNSAIHFTDNIKRQIYLLSTQPYIGKKENFQQIDCKNIRSLIVHKYYKLLYFVDETEGNIVIVLLWHTLQKPERLPEVLSNSR